MPEEKVTIELPFGVTQADLDRALKAFTKTGKSISSSEPIIFEEIELNPTNLTRVYRDVYKGREVLSIRKFWRKEAEEGDWQPGKGVTFPYDAIDQIISGLSRMKEWCGGHPGKIEEEE